MKSLQNGLIAQLSSSERALVEARCNLIVLQPGDVLSSPESTDQVIYFLTRGSVAMVVGRSNHHVGLAVGLIGAEGAVGLQHIFGFGPGNLTLLVQSAGEALRTNGLAMRRLMDSNPKLKGVFSRYLWTVYQDVAALAAQTQSQDIKARLAGWIYLSATRSNSNALELTQTYLAKMLGVRRASITQAAIELKEQKLMQYKRGRIEVLNLAGLKRSAGWY